MNRLTTTELIERLWRDAQNSVASKDGMILGPCPLDYSRLLEMVDGMIQHRLIEHRLCEGQGHKP